MKLCNVFVAVMFAATMAVSADADTLVPNGDFSVADGDSWNSATSGGPITWETVGGNTGGFGKIDATAGSWGGVLVAEGGTGPANAGGDGIPLSVLGFSPGETITVHWDQIDLLGNGAIAGIKMESRLGAGLVSDSGDQLFATTASWKTETFDYVIAAGADSLKFVMVQNQGGALAPVGAVTGFDNVGYVSAVPEPASLSLLALGLTGLVARRRRS